MEMLDALSGLLADPAILHSNQGWRYQQFAYQRRLEEMGLVRGMSKKATCLDSACVEGFFEHLKDTDNGNRVAGEGHRRKCT